MVTIRDVAERAGVSTSTVSHVVNNTRYVSEATRQRVQDAMSTLQYQPNHVASSLRSRKTRTLGVLMPNSANPYFARILAAIESASYEAGYNVIIGNANNDQREKDYLDVMRSKQVDGVLLISTGNFAQSIASLQNAGVPVVLVDRPAPQTDLDTVMADNHAGGYMAAHHLIQLGHRAIGCITGPDNLITSTARYDGYRQALHEAGITPNDNWRTSGAFDHESGYHAALTLLQRTPRPTALFVCNDMMAIGAIRAASELGIALPDELSLVGFDNVSLSAYTQPPLTTIEQPADDMGARAVQQLLARIETPEMPYHREMLSVKLIERHSCKPTNNTL